VCPAGELRLVDVLRFCHHEGDGDIEQERAEEVGGVKPSREGQDDWQALLFLKGRLIGWLTPCSKYNCDFCQA
jgi:hypothetical protein